jgi:branched-chain amino acid transport system ATP-binding protein
MSDSRGHLSVSNLSVGYGGAPVIQDASLEVKPGEVVAVLGANGAGKTTLLKTISGAMRPIAGSLVCDGVDFSGLGPDGTLRHGIAHVLEGRRIFDSLSVEENLLLGGHVLPKRGRDGELGRLYEVFPDLRRLRKLQGRALSGGQQQMLAIGRALMARPKVLLLDEPSLGLSPRLVETLEELLKAVGARLGTSILLVEQTVWLALGLALRIYTMESGHLREAGTRHELDVSALSASYLGGTEDTGAVNE